MKKYNLMVIAQNDKPLLEKIISEKELLIHDSCNLTTPLEEGSYFAVLVPDKTSKKIADKIITEVQKTVDNTFTMIDIPELLEVVKKSIIKV